jgi:hypothetical protein
MINMRQLLSFLCLFLLVACGGKDLGPEPRIRDEIMRDLSSLPILYLTKDERKREAPGGQAYFVDEISHKIFWMALECKNPKCPVRTESGESHIFIMPEPGVFVNKKGDLDFDPEAEEQAIRKGGFFGCEKCIPLRQRHMLASGRGAETQAEKIQYAEFVVPHMLPESKKRSEELEKEMAARVAWEKDNAP